MKADSGLHRAWVVQTLRLNGAAAPPARYGDLGGGVVLNRRAKVSRMPIDQATRERVGGIVRLLDPRAAQAEALAPSAFHLCAPRRRVSTARGYEATPVEMGINGEYGGTWGRWVSGADSEEPSGDEHRRCTRRRLGDGGADLRGLGLDEVADKDRSTRCSLVCAACSSYCDAHSLSPATGPPRSPYRLTP